MARFGGRHALTYAERSDLIAWTRRTSRHHVASQLGIAVATLDRLIIGAGRSHSETLARVRPRMTRAGIGDRGIKPTLTLLRGGKQ